MTDLALLDAVLSSIKERPFMHWRIPDHSSLYKNKSILRSVDQTIAEQGRWSVFGHLIIFVVVEWLMGFRAIPAVLSYSFAIVLLSVALVRLYYLLNFTQQYGRGPVRWRLHYGLLTLLGAGLWSAYLTLTIVHPGYTYSLTFVWIYTAAVVATHIFIFAAYRTMAQWYNGILLIPPGVAGILMWQWEMVTLGIALLLYFAFMELSSRQVSARFWDTQRSRQSLELALGETSAAEHQAALKAEANQHSLLQLIQMIRQPVAGLMGQLQAANGFDSRAQVGVAAAQYAYQLTAVLDQFELYVRIQSREFADVDKVFSINRQIEQALLDAEPVASARGLDLSCAIDPNVPERLMGQAQLVFFTLRHAILFALDSAQGEEVMIKIQTDEDMQNLWFKVRFDAQMSDQYWQLCQTLIRSDHTIESLPQYQEALLSLAICVLLARQKNGVVNLSASGISEFPMEFTVRIPIEMSSQSERRFQADKALVEQSIWIYGFPTFGAKALTAELESWGMNVTQLKEGDSLSDDAAFDFGLLNVMAPESLEMPIIQQAQAITEHRIAALYDFAQTATIAKNNPHITWIRKPWLRRSLHRWLVRQMQVAETIELSSAAQIRLTQARMLLISKDASLYQQLTHWLKPKELTMVSDAERALSQTEQHKFDIIWIDGEQVEAHAFDLIAQVRAQERAQQLEPTPVITLVLTNDPTANLSQLSSSADVLAKPLQRDQLHESIERIWGS